MVAARPDPVEHGYRGHAGIHSHRPAPGDGLRPGAASGDHAAARRLTDREDPMLRDLSLPELRQYRPAVEEPADVADVTFPGYAGDPIKGWLLLPHASPPDRAFVVEYVGYGGGRGDPFEWLTWSCAGHPHLRSGDRRE